MLLASYKFTRPGLQGIANRLIRLRLRGPYSHSEVVFEPGDGVDAWMPDGTCAQINGELWCYSSVAAERLPLWSKRRLGAQGGCRFKRIRLDPARWDVVRYPADAYAAARMAFALEGSLYGWQLILGYLSWLIPAKSGRYTCSQIAAQLGGFADAWRFDCCVLHSAVSAMAHNDADPNAR